MDFIFHNLYAWACSLFSDIFQRHRVLNTKLLNKLFLKNPPILSVIVFRKRSTPWWKVFCQSCTVEIDRIRVTALTVTEHLCHKYTRILFTIWSFPHSWLITGFATSVTRRVPLVEQELHTLPEQMRSPLVRFRLLSLYSFLCNAL